MESLARLAILVQGLYYLITGIWPVVSIETFQWVTGPKIEHWLVQTVGALAAAIGLSLLFGLGRPRISRETLALGIAAAAAFALVDFYFFAVGRIGAVYAADGVVQLVFIGLLGVAAVLRRRGRQSGE